MWVRSAPNQARCNRSIVLLLFLQKQNLATAIYLFGLGTLLTGLGLKHKSELYLQSFLTVDNRHPPKTRGTHRGLDTWTCPKSCVFQVIYSVQHRRQNDGVHGTKVHCGLRTTIQHDSLHQKTKNIPRHARVHITHLEYSRAVLTLQQYWVQILYHTLVPWY